MDPLCKKYFNPRSREGSDSVNLPLPISPENFNPRSREGSDIKFRPLLLFVNLFQSTLPRGERLHQLKHTRLVPYFNPRSREGSDCKNTQTTNIISVYFYLYYIIFVSLATNTAYITITKPSKCRCESPYTFC